MPDTRPMDEMPVDMDAACARIAGLQQQVADLQARQRTLIAAEEQYRRCLEQAHDGVVVVQDAVILFANTALAALIGREPAELIGTDFNSIIDARAFPQRAAVSGVPECAALYEAALVHTAGHKVCVEFSSAPVKYSGRRAQLVFIRDISRRKTLEAQLLQAQKMELVGKLAGGIAHDFNNLLTAVINYAVLARESVPADTVAAHDTEQIALIGRRAAVLVRQLLIFSRRSAAIYEPACIETVLTSLQPMMRHLLRADINLEILAQTQNAYVDMDAGHLEQIIINLVVNARDAIAEKGRITIVTQRVTVGTDIAGVAPGSYIGITVKDTGCGIPADIAQRIFEPFFTTKDPGRGTGLGLATVYMLVQQYKGGIVFESLPDQGTEFNVYIPLSKKPLPEVCRQVTEQLPRGNETVLLVEDDTVVRDIIERLLKRLGYTVISVASGIEAVRVAAATKGLLHVLISDVIMPDAHGRDVAQRVRASQPDIGVLFISGYMPEQCLGSGFEHEAFLQKPFTEAALAQKMRSVLNKRGPHET